MFPETADLVINDYLVGDKFSTQVSQLENEGSRIDVVGCQMHIFGPKDVILYSDGERWAEVEAAIVAPAAGEYTLMRFNDYWGEIIVNGVSLGKFEGPYAYPVPLKVKLQKGVNKLVHRTRAGSGGNWKCGFLIPGTSPLTTND